MKNILTMNNIIMAEGFRAIGKSKKKKNSIHLLVYLFELLEFYFLF